MNKNCNTGKSMNARSSKEEQNDRLSLKTSIECVRLLCMQAMAYSGHDDVFSSTFPDSFIELIKLTATYNPRINDVVLDNAPKDAQYTSPEFQKDILHIFADQVKTEIRKEVGDAKFCIIYDEVKDITYKHQIAVAIVLRYVDVNGFLQERFFDIVLVNDDATAETIKKAISDTLIKYNLNISSMRGHGYDGSNNRRYAWNKLPALFLRDSPYAYYVHGFAYRLDLALVAASEDDISIWKFFDTLNRFVNLITDPITLGQLQSAEAIEKANMVAIGERDTNQIGNLQRAGKIDWTSHFESICHIIDNYIPVIDVLENIEDECRYSSMRYDAHRCSIDMWSFEFIFVLHVMYRIMMITEFLCKAFQDKNLDIPNTMDFVRSTKTLLQTLREDGFDDLLMHVKSFCSEHGNDIPNMNGPSKFAKMLKRRGEKDDTTEEQYYHNVFNAAIDSRLEELNSRFSDDAMELLRLSSALEPKDNFKSFDVDHIYNLAKKFYPDDFDEQELQGLLNQLQHYKLTIVPHKRFQGMTTIPELCRRLVETNKAPLYDMIDRLIRLVLTLPVSTPTTERAVSAMKDVRTVLCDKKGQEEYLTDSMVPYIEREIGESIETDSIIDEFYSKRNRKVGLGP